MKGTWRNAREREHREKAQRERESEERTRREKRKRNKRVEIEPSHPPLFVTSSAVQARNKSSLTLTQKQELAEGREVNDVDKAFGYPGRILWDLAFDVQ
eukprot:74724-Rhodomonas_salina.3